MVNFIPACLDYHCAHIAMLAAKKHYYRLKEPLVWL